MRRNVLAAGAALALVAGFAAVSSEASAAHNATGLQMRLASATRVAHEHRGTGYWLVSSTGAVSHFGSAKFYGSMAGRHLKAPIIGIVATADDRGYWLVAKDGGVFSFGDATFQGSLGDKTLTEPIVGMASSSGVQGGTAGPQGVRGRAGARGATGPRGAVGARGPIGLAGATGAIGPAGATGAIGPAGEKGAIGPDGAKGATGAVGPEGATGAVGPKGATGAVGATGVTGATGAKGATGTSGTSEFAEFFALMPPDNAATVAAGTAVSFPQDGPADGSGLISRLNANQFVLSDIGTYNVSFAVSVTEAGQLELTLNGAALAYTVIGRATGTSEIVGESLVTTTTVNSFLSVLNPAGESTALTITPLAGGTHPVGASLVIQQLG
jgi:hypothetical protein